MDEMHSVIREFVSESRESLDQLDLIALEEDPNCAEILAGIFLTIQSVKSTCGFLGFWRLESLAQVGEGLLSRLLDGSVPPSPEITAALTLMVDSIRQILTDIEAAGDDGDADCGDVIEILTRLQSTDQTHPGTAQGAADPEAPCDPVGPVIPGSARVEAEESELRAMGELLVEEGRIEKEELEAAIVQQAAGDPRHIGEILVESGALRHEDVRLALGRQRRDEAKAAISKGFIRVDVAQLDRLMSLAEELIVARNQILRCTVTKGNAALSSALQRLGQVTSDLLRDVTKVRMRPIQVIWHQFPWVVRHLAHRCGKRAEVTLEGGETELDQTILEALRDPLRHLIRNAVDHGIEPPDERTRVGKPPQGTVRLRAEHGAGQVMVEVSDDGRGVDCEEIRRQAQVRGLVTPEQAAQMDAHATVNLVLLPGFSTADEATRVPGQGVGMDEVRSNVERLGGRVELSSSPGCGTTVKMEIPLTRPIPPGPPD